VFFDEMMKSVPSGHPEIFLAVSQISIYVALIGAPLLGTMLANFIGLGGTLWVSAGLCSLSFLMFLGDSN
jgi:predicted MFS family arabinose efflux permease